MSRLPPARPGTYGPAGSHGPSAPAHWAAYGSPQSWAPPPAWGPPPGWVQPGWGAGGWAPGWIPARRSPAFDWSRLLPTLAVAFVIGAVVFGGIVLDNSITAPSAGVVTVGGSVTMTAGPGWVGVAVAGRLILRNRVAQGRRRPHGPGGLAELLRRRGFDARGSGGVARRRHGPDQLRRSTNDFDERARHHVRGLRGNVGDGPRLGRRRWGLICMVVNGNAVVIVVAAAQGHLDPVID